MEPVNDEKHNQSPKGTMRSAVPLHCFFDVLKSHKVAGKQPSARPLFIWSTRLLSKGSEGQLEWSEGLTEWFE